MGRTFYGFIAIHAALHQFDAQSKLNLLRANSLYYYGIHRFAEAEFLVSENGQREGWLIFYMHDAPG
jgi:hypothetical protein